MKYKLPLIARVILRSAGTFFELFLAFGVLWWLVGTLLSVSKTAPPRLSSGDLNKDVRIYIVNNGVHTDVLVPVANEQIDWGKELGISEQLAKDTTGRDYLAFGWGNEQFFMKTKNWSDLTVRTAFNSIFHLGTSAMHIVHKKAPEKASGDVVELVIDKRKYRRLTGFIRASFSKKNGQYIPITDHPYGEHDFFFKADRSYGLTYTCNSWTNDAVKAAGQPAARWTAFTDGVFRFLPKEDISRRRN